MAILSPIEDIIEDVRDGKMVIIVDDENRENEGDFIVSAAKMNLEQMVQMINYSSGIVCLVIDEERRARLDLQLVRRRGMCPNGTAFLDSIEARNGISTGVSAADRLHTIKTAISEDANEGSLVTPGHVFTLLANKGGLMARQGHTEASIAIMKLAGLDESAVLCEIMNKDGTMARLPDLMIIAEEIGMKIGSIADLMAHLEKNNFCQVDLGEKLCTMSENVN